MVRKDPALRTAPCRVIPETFAFLPGTNQSPPTVRPLGTPGSFRLNYQKNWPICAQAVATGAVTPDQQPLKQTPLYGQHSSLGARLVPYAGWTMPVQYSGIVAEHTAVRRYAGLFDVSHMGRLEITGPRALEGTDRLITNDLQRTADGHAVYACCCKDDGGILDDLIVYRHSAEHIFVICNAANLQKIAGHFARELGEGSKLTDLSSVTGLLALQGPESAAIADDLGLSNAVRLTRFSFCEDRLGSVPVLITRTGYTGEDGFEIVVPAADLVNCWKTILSKGASRGLVPIGLGARDTLRLEACLSLYGHEIDETTHPLEAGLGFAVKLNKQDFVGRAALVKAKSEPFRRKLVGLVVLGRGIAREGYPIMNLSGQVIGKVTSGAPGPSVGKNIALGYVPVASSTVGSSLLVDCRGKPVESEVVPTPFYRRA